MKAVKAHAHKELKPEELKLRCSPETFNFDSTGEITPVNEIIGQERALKALKIGVELWSPGYNIFITGLSGTGKATTVKKMLESIRPKCPVLNDYAYVNNFEDQDNPLLLVFPAGEAAKFKHDLASTIQYLQNKIPQALEAESYKVERKKILSEFSSREQVLMNTFEEKLKKENFSLGQIKVGEASRPEVLPVVENQPIFIQQLEEQVRKGKIDKEKAMEISTKYALYQEELQSVFKKGLKLSQDYQEKLQQLEKETVNVIVKGAISNIKEKYKWEKVDRYLDQVEKNIFNSLDVFKGVRPKTEETEEGIVIDYYKEYEVNIILDNTHTKECPIVIETTPSYNNLFGTIEKFSDGHGGWYADFTKIKAGSFLKANGGYLVLNAMDAFQEPGVWKSLKRVLMYGKLEIQDFFSYYQFSPTVLKPEPIDCNTKVIFIGNQYMYSLLASYEDDFKKIFKIKSDFDYEMRRTDHNLQEYAGVIKKLIENEKLMEFDKSAIAAVIEYSSRYAGQKEKLTTRFSFIADLLRESSFWAKDDGESIVCEYHVHQAYNNSRERHALYESKISEMIEEGSILIDTEGERTGQINGLAVYGSDYFSFGKPTRITASVSLGAGNLINVEREAGLSGSTHNKGVLIISGYFRETFGQRIPLSFSASLVFEQGYGMIDGDSASAAEVCALLSTFSELPLRQSIAITGSVNQKGDIQPVGGINEKIEGFFDVCRRRGLDRHHGVIIPAQNVKDLMLRDDIIDAAKEGKFHVYAVSRIEEAIEILTGVKAGKPDKSGHFGQNTVFGLVEKKLKDMYAKIKPVARKNGADGVVKQNGQTLSKEVNKRLPAVSQKKK
ncbi:MAG: AAA family ATPase [Ignavibacteria bacterium]|jgi:ATP-dependent Lon protease|nr:AAA family ATPase [Ignavibacteria bacterium]MCU7503241.1 AAA family ATPase [Ignavibacteria bacterium]MCU7517310.1 AAA family ATPase [Ignavibacteria bacterium]